MNKTRKVADIMTVEEIKDELEKLGRELNNTKYSIKVRDIKLRKMEKLQKKLALKIGEKNDK